MDNKAMLDALREFVIEVAKRGKNRQATPEELKALPEVALIVLEWKR